MAAVFRVDLFTTFLNLVQFLFSHLSKHYKSQSVLFLSVCLSAYLFLFYSPLYLEEISKRPIFVSGSGPARLRKAAKLDTSADELGTFEASLTRQLSFSHPPQESTSPSVAKVCLSHMRIDLFSYFALRSFVGFLVCC